MQQIPVYILAGGKSSRFGSDKARALLHGKPLISHVAAALRCVASQVTAVADVVDKFNDLSIRTIADVRPNLGPIAGLHAALNDCDESRLILTSCDFPNLNPAWVTTLIEHDLDAADAVAFKSDRWQPLPALYHTSIAARVASHMDGGVLSLQRFLDEAHTIALPTPRDWPRITGFNTSQELKDHA